MKRILVTGASGFLGKALIKRLEKEGNKVYSSRIDILNATELKFCFSSLEPQIIFHLAANSSGRATMEETFRDNVVGTYNVVRAMPKDCKLIFASSSLVYGNSHPNPSEQYLGAADCAYGASKLAAEAYVHKVLGTSCRITGIIGPNMRKGVILHLIKEAKKLTSRKYAPWTGISHTGGSKSNVISTFNSKPGSTLQYIHIDDVVTSLISCMNDKGGPVNVTTSNPINIERVIEIIQEELGTNKEINWQGKEESRYYNLQKVIVRKYPLLKYPTTELALRATLEHYK